MDVRFILTIAAAATAFNAAYAAPPSKTDVIQCGVDAGSRLEDERRAFVEGCVTMKSKARETGRGTDPAQPKQFNCQKLAETAYHKSKKSFVEGCMKAKKDASADAKPAAASGK